MKFYQKPVFWFRAMLFGVLILIINSGTLESIPVAIIVAAFILFSVSMKTAIEIYNDYRNKPKK